MSLLSKKIRRAKSILSSIDKINHRRMEPFTFEELPEAVTKLYLKLKKIEKLLKQNIYLVTQQEELMSIEEAAELLKLSVATIYSKVCRKEIPVDKQGKRLYFSRTELMEWIRSERVKGNDELRKIADAYIRDKKLRSVKG